MSSASRLCSPAVNQHDEWRPKQGRLRVAHRTAAVACRVARRVGSRVGSRAPVSNRAPVCGGVVGGSVQDGARGVPAGRLRSASGKGLGTEHGARHSVPLDATGRVDCVGDCRVGARVRVEQQQRRLRERLGDLPACMRRGGGGVGDRSEDGFRGWEGGRGRAGAPGLLRKSRTRRSAPEGRTSWTCHGRVGGRGRCG